MSVPIVDDDGKEVGELATVDVPTGFAAMIGFTAEQLGQLDTDKLKAMLDMKERYDRSEAEKAFWRAMSECQEEMPGAVFKSKKGRNNNYAPFEDLNRVLRPIYTKHGFSLTFTQDPSAQTRENWIRMVCEVGHRDGHTRRYMGDYPLDGTGPKGGQIAMNELQACGSTRSYAKRYMLKDVFNIAEGDEDNDGAGANNGATFITMEGAGCQYDQIQDLFLQIGDAGFVLKETAVLQWLGVQEWKQLPAKDFDKCTGYLKKKLSEALAAKKGK